jgi:hypothetical protein
MGNRQANDYQIVLVASLPYPAQGVNARGAELSIWKFFYVIKSTRLCSGILACISGQYEHCCNQTQSGEFCPFLEAYTQSFRTHDLTRYPE